MKTFKQFLREDKEYMALVKDKQSGELSLITRNYPTLRDFKHDLRSNGYIVKRAADKDSYEKYLNMSDFDRQMDSIERRRKRLMRSIERSRREREEMENKGE